MTIRLLLAAGSAHVRTALRQMLELQADMKVAGEAADSATAVALARDLRPDILLLDMRLPGSGGLVVTAFLCATAPEVRVILLAPFDCHGAEAEIAATGATSCINTYGPPQEVLEIIRRSCPGC